MLQTKVGTFQKRATVGAQAIVGLGFTPKAIIFFTSGTQGLDAWQQHYRQMVGFTTGAAASRSVGVSSKDAVNGSSVRARAAAKAISIVEFDATAIWEADLQSFDADGFTLNWTTSGTAAVFDIMYLAIGGADLTNAAVVEWTAPTVVGNKAVTGVGFKPDLVLHLPAPDATALPATTVTGYLAFGAMNAQGQQWSHSFVAQNTANPSNASRWQQADAAIAQVELTEGLRQQAHFVSMDADGFTTAFSSVEVTANKKIFSLCLKGVASNLGSYRQGTPLIGDKTVVARAGFRPRAALFGSYVGSIVGVPQNHALWTMGAIAETGEQVAVGAYDTDNASPTAARAASSATRSLLGGFALATQFEERTRTTDDGFVADHRVNGIGTHALYLEIGDAGPVPGPYRAWSSVTPNATGDRPNQKKLARTADGTIWALSYSGAGGLANLTYSKDEGKTWALAQQFDGMGSDYSIFVDEDDFLHVVWKQNGVAGGRTDGFGYYMRGTPNVGRTLFTMSAIQIVYGNAAGISYDLVAHREGTGWRAHIVWSTFAGASNFTWYLRFSITAAAVIAVEQANVQIGGDYAVAGSTYPSIDFNHTGNGKSVKGGTPHLYVSWTGAATGANAGLRARRAVYAAGAWTWDVEIAAHRAWFPNTGPRWCNSLWDGNHWMLIGFGTDSNTDAFRLIMEMLDGITPFIHDYTQLTDALRNRNYYGSAAYDALGNLYFAGNDHGTDANAQLVLWKWHRASKQVVSQVVDVCHIGPFVSMRKGVAHDTIGFVYTKGNQSPYDVKYAAIQLPLSDEGFTIPNEAAATDPEQSEFDAVDIRLVSRGLRGDGVVAGCEVRVRGADQPNTRVLLVEEGVFSTQDVFRPVMRQQVLVPAADGANPRFDLVCLDTDGVALTVAGAAAAEPSFPALPVGYVVLASIYVPAASADVLAGHITDKRLWLALPPQSQSAVTNTSEAASGTTYGDLVTWGPAVSVMAPASGKVLVGLASVISNASGAATFMGFDVLQGGVVVVAATDIQAIEQQQANAQQYGASYLVTGLPPGPYTIVAKYRIASASTGTFKWRNLVATPVP